jgi:putative tricarboxylic transport membrane protein
MVLAWAGPVALLALAAAAARQALGYGLWVDGEPGPGLFPLVACLLIGLGGVPVMAETVRGRAVTPDEEASPPTPLKLAAYVCVLAAWPLLLQPLGYWAASALALFVLLRVGGVGWLGSSAVTAAAVAGSVLLFETLLEVPLPQGRWS